MRGKSKQEYYGQSKGWLPADVYPSEPGVYRVSSTVWRRFDGEQWYRGAQDPKRAALVDTPAKYATPWKPWPGKHPVVQRAKPKGNGDAANFAPTDLWSAIAHVQTIAEASGYAIEIKSVKKLEARQ